MVDVSPRILYKTFFFHVAVISAHVLPPTESETMSKTIIITDGFGKMSRRKRETVIRFHKYNKDAEPSNWYRAKLKLYYPWYNEDTDLLGVMKHMHSITKMSNQ